MDNDEIKLLQISLNELLPYDISDTGHFGQYIEKMVKLFREKHNMDGEGIVDDQLWEKIISKNDLILSNFFF